jgi:ketosteroid isomerase-like protein
VTGRGRRSHGLRAERERGRASARELVATGRATCAPGDHAVGAYECRPAGRGRVRAYLWPIDEDGDVDPTEPAVVARRFLEAFSAADFERMRGLLAEDVVAYITNAEGGVDKIEGRESYLGRLEAMDLPSARFSVELTQAPVSVDPDRVLVMVEVHAHREGRSLHNFAAHLLRVTDGRITDWRMVDAKPSESDEFWS